MPVGLLLLVGLIAGGAYALSQRGSDEGSSAPAKKKAPPPRTLTEQLPGGGRNAKAEEVKAKIEAVRKKAEQGDKDAGRVLEDLKRLYGNVTK